MKKAHTYVGSGGFPGTYGWTVDDLWSVELEPDVSAAGKSQRRERADRDGETLDQLHLSTSLKGLLGDLAPRPMLISPTLALPNKRRMIGGTIGGPPNGPQDASPPYRTHRTYLASEGAKEVVPTTFMTRQDESFAPERVGE